MILRPLPLTHRRNGVVVGTVALSMTSATRYTRQLPDGSDGYIIQLARSPEFRWLLHKTRPAMPSDNHVKAAFRAMLKHSPATFHVFPCIFPCIFPCPAAWHWTSVFCERPRTAVWCSFLPVPCTSPCLLQMSTNQTAIASFVFW